MMPDSLEKLYKFMLYSALAVSLANTVLTLVKLMVFEGKTVDYAFLILWFTASLILIANLRKNHTK